jgi:hypothetical protein
MTNGTPEQGAASVSWGSQVSEAALPNLSRRFDVDEFTSFVVPAKPGDADKLAGELGELATACEWKRAAIVYARVRVSEHGGHRSKTKTGLANGKIGPKEYALRGVHGLRSPTTIRRYWWAWQHAIDEGLAEPVELGDTIMLPDAEWADYCTPVDRSVPPWANTASPPTPIPHESRRGGDGLGLGECPPKSSDLDDLEDDAEEPEDELEDALEDEAIAERQQEILQDRPRPRPLVSDVQLNAGRMKLLSNSINCAERDLDNLLEILDQLPVQLSGEWIRKRITKIRDRLDDIERGLG